MRSIVCTILIFLAIFAQAQVAVSNKLFRYTGPAGFAKGRANAPINALLVGPTRKKFASNIGLIWTSDEGKTLEVWLEEVRQQRGMESGTTVTQQKTMSLGGREARFIIVTNGSDSTKQLIVASIQQGKLVAILFTANKDVFPQQLKAFQASLKSFKWAS